MVLGKALISLCCVFQDGPISISNQFFYLMPVFFPLWSWAGVSVSLVWGLLFIQVSYWWSEVMVVWRDDSVGSL